LHTYVNGIGVIEFKHVHLKFADFFQYCSASVVCDLAYKLYEKRGRGSIRSKYLFIIKNRTQSTSKKKTNTDTKKTQKYRHTHKKESEINPKDESRNQPVHRAVIKHEISSVLNILAQSSGLSLNNKKSFRTETFANSSADTLDK